MCYTFHKTVSVCVELKYISGICSGDLGLYQLTNTIIEMTLLIWQTLFIIIISKLSQAKIDHSKDFTIPSNSGN